MSKIELNTYNQKKKNQCTIHMKILKGKPQLKTPLSVLSYKVEIHQKIYTKP